MLIYTLFAGNAMSWKTHLTSHAACEKNIKRTFIIKYTYEFLRSKVTKLIDESVPEGRMRQ